VLTRTSRTRVPAERRAQCPDFWNSGRSSEWQGLTCPFASRTGPPATRRELPAQGPGFRRRWKAGRVPPSTPPTAGAVCAPPWEPTKPASLARNTRRLSRWVEGHGKRSLKVYCPSWTPPPRRRAGALWSIVRARQSFLSELFSFSRADKAVELLWNSDEASARSSTWRLPHVDLSSVGIRSGAKRALTEGRRAAGRFCGGPRSRVRSTGGIAVVERRTNVPRLGHAVPRRDGGA